MHEIELYINVNNCVTIYRIYIYNIYIVCIYTHTVLSHNQLIYLVTDFSSESISPTETILQPVVGSKFWKVSCGYVQYL